MTRLSTLRAVLALVVLGAAAVVPLRADAGGFSNPDFGIRRLGMFAITAKADDPTAIFHNPACLTLEEGTHLYHAQSWFFMSLGLRLYDSQGVLRPDHEINPDWSVGAIPFVAIASDLGTKNLRIGFAAYASNGYGASLPDNEPTRYSVTRALFLAPRATASIAYKFDDKFSLGASFDIVYVFITAKRMMNALVLANPDRRFDPVSQTQATDAELNIRGSDWTWAWNLGMMFTPIPELRFGLAFSSGSAIDLRGPVTLTYPDGRVEKATQSTIMSIPFELKFGFNWEFVKDFELGADIYWWHYQVMQEQRTTLSSPLMGLPGFTDPMNYTNSWAWNVGMMYHILPELEIMAGWQMDFTPIPAQTYSFNNPSTNQDGVSLGIRWQCTDHVRLGLAMVRNWFQLVDVQTSTSTPPSNAKGHGANFEVGFDIDWKF